MKKFLIFIIIIISPCIMVLAQPTTPVAWYPFNGNANDAVGTVHGTVIGATLTEDRLGNPNSAYYFNGEGDNIELGKSVLIRPYPEITICGWFQFEIPVRDDPFQTIVSTGLHYGYEVGRDRDRDEIYLNFGHSSHRGGINATNYKVGWHHFASIYDGTYMRLYLDGNLVYNYPIGNISFDYDPRLPAFIGAQPSNKSYDDNVAIIVPQHFWKGKIDDLRFFNIALSGQQVADEFNRLDESNPPSPIAFYSFNGNANDAIGTVHGAVSGAILTTDRFGNPNCAYYFDGLNSVINLGKSEIIRPRTAITVMAWFNMENQGRTDAAILSCLQGPGYQFMVDNGNLNLRLQFQTGKRETASNSVEGFNDGWHHIAGTYDGYSMNFYLDGNLVNTIPVSGKPPIDYHPEVNTLIGADPDNNYGNGVLPGSYWKGKIDEVKFFNAALTGQEILDEFNRPNDMDCDPSDPEKYQSANLYIDADIDGYDAGQEVICYGADIPIGFNLTTLGADCDDTNGLINPGASELCDGLDNDCDAQIDEGCPRTWYRDRDKDGYGTNINTRFQVLQPTGFVALYGDCNDNDNTIYPGAPELGEGLDNNCNGQVDEGLPCQIRWYRDVDGDGHGTPTTSFLSCMGKTGYVNNSGDCKDNDIAIHPGATELPDNKDNNCNVLVDEGLVCPAWYKDADLDGKGNPKLRKISCVKPAGYIENGDDCNDADNSTYAGAPEIPDGKDNNCDGQIDEGLPCRVAWYFDADKDGYGNWKTSKLSCVQPTGYVSSGLDCSDTDPNINPGLPEICGDGKDNNCNGIKDEFCVIITGVDPGLGIETVTNRKTLSAENQPIGQLEIGVRPNPANNTLFIDLNFFEPNKKMELVLMQADGKPMLSQSLLPTLKGQQVRLDIARLSAGYYVLLVKQGYLQQTKKVMIVR